MTFQVLPEPYGKPGGPGGIVVTYLNDLYPGATIAIHLLESRQGGKGGPVVRKSTVQEKEVAIANRGGAGGGRENVPIIVALTNYANSLKDTAQPPLIFLEPGEHRVVWPYETSTATLVNIGPGGGGGGGAGNIVEGLDGEDGLMGAAFLFPTDIPLSQIKS